MDCCAAGPASVVDFSAFSANLITLLGSSRWRALASGLLAGKVRLQGLNGLVFLPPVDALLWLFWRMFVADVNSIEVEVFSRVPE